MNVPRRYASGTQLPTLPGTITAGVTALPSEQLRGFPKPRYATPNTLRPNFKHEHKQSAAASINVPDRLRVLFISNDDAAGWTLAISEGKEATTIGLAGPVARKFTSIPPESPRSADKSLLLR